MSSPRRDGGAVFAVALAARLAVVAWVGTRFPAADDGVRYDALAARLAAGLGYTWAWPDGAVTTVAHYPVGYPAALALAYRVFGHSVVVAGVENACLGALAALAAHRLALAVADRRVALWAGLAVALHPGLVLYTTALMTEGLTATLVAVAAWIALRGASRAPAGHASLVGVVVGLAGLVRPQTLLLAPLLGLLAAGKRGAILGATVAALVCTPWVVRNCSAVGRCTLSTNSGWNLLIGAQPGATGKWQAVKVPEACKDVFGESTTDACFGREAVEDIEAAPWRWVALAPRKLAATFDYGGFGGYYLYLSNARLFSWSAVVAAGALETLYERAAVALCLLGMGRADGPRRRARRWMAGTGALLNVSPWGWCAVLCLCVGQACLGVQGLRRNPLQAACLFVVGSLVAVHAVFFGVPRYALPAVPVLTALAVVSVAQWRATRV